MNCSTSFSLSEVLFSALDLLLNFLKIFVGTALGYSIALGTKKQTEIIFESIKFVLQSSKHSADNEITGLNDKFTASKVEQSRIKKGWLTISIVLAIVVVLLETFKAEIQSFITRVA